MVVINRVFADQDAAVVTFGPPPSSQTSGLSKNTTSRLIELLGPLIRGAIARQLHGSEALSKTFEKQLQHYCGAINSQHGDVLGKIFDQDNDGDFDMSQVAEVAMSRC